MNRSQIQQRLQEIKAEISALRGKLASARESGYVWTARWYAERIATRDDERRELEWEIH